MKNVYLLLGSNSGDKIKILKKAAALISQKIGHLKLLSSIYQTEPWGNKDQPAFLNQVLLAETKLQPLEVLKYILEIEKAEGRVRTEKWTPRTLDIDILYYDDQIIVSSELKVPHAELHNRKFTLIPLAEIAPDFKHPVFNLTNKEILARCKDELGVKKLSPFGDE